MKIYELLGLKPLEKFRIKNNDNQSIFCFNSDDELCYYIETCHINYGNTFTVTLHPCKKENVINLIHNPELIEIVEEKSITKENTIKENTTKNTFELPEHDIIILMTVQQFYNKIINRVFKMQNEKGFYVFFKGWSKSFYIENCELERLNEYLKDNDYLTLTCNVAWTNDMKCYLEVLNK